MKSYKNKVVWITGASSGIGRATAIEMAKEQAILILSGTNEEKLEKAAAECRKYGAEVFTAAFNLQDEESIQQAFKKVTEKFDRIDLLFNNGGISQRSKVHETSLEVDRKIMETNFFGGVSLTKKVLPIMIRQGRGHIAATSSISGKFGFHLRSAYAASKFAIQGFYETLGIEMEEFGIKSTIVIPGRIKTDISISALNKDGKPHGLMDEGQQKGMSAEKCARKIVKAFKRGKREVLIGGADLIMVYIRRFFPKLFFVMVKRIKAT